MFAVIFIKLLPRVYWCYVCRYFHQATARITCRRLFFSYLFTELFLSFIRSAIFVRGSFFIHWLITYFWFLFAIFFPAERHAESFTPPPAPLIKIDQFYVSGSLIKLNLWHICPALFLTTGHTEIYLRNLIKSNRNQIVFTIFQLILNSNGHVCLCSKSIGAW